ncbi:MULTISPECIES: hypothetical protein [Pseudoxanthomonas]|uniref:Membrane protein n=1 Tax=Pseudoxanthomonas winnipegensis TaxID=2480810 RepID=A0AAW8GE07_9GAMM|nr:MULTISPECIES: hypothetical protein [Pseudoxanthomonas]MDQ1119236.1 putative membrane protein [Pseudoxanthomonas winnipegensis]MDQ1132428.1 putative membrane protein [Pseudoxanthomonas winnipegensis]MDR6137562.1 putative membrane protein [Pseudoxanthomonas sp. SORGH_AS_0997]
MPSLHEVSPLIAWMVSAMGLLAAALLVWFGLRWRRGRRTWGLPLIAALLVLAASLALKLASRAAQDKADRAQAMTRPLSPQEQAVWSIVQTRCQACHSDHATVMPWAAYGLSLDDMGDVERNAAAIQLQVVQLQAMPMRNTTQMTPQEREVIARWYAERATSAHGTKGD